VTDADAVLPTRLHPSGFTMADSNFYSLTRVSDGRLYYTLCSHNINTHGRVYRYDTTTETVELICDLGEVAGEAGLKTLPQGKSHSPFFEREGILYFATHYGYFATTDKREEPADVPEGYKPYPGGHLMSYNMGTGELRDLAKAPPEEGILTLNMDPRRGLLYGLTWPKGYFLVYDIAAGELRNLGPACGGGEAGRGEDYFCLVRSFAVDPRDGRVYFTCADGRVVRYDPDHAPDRVETVEGLSFKRDIFGCWDHTRPGHQGYNWRDIRWHEPTGLFWGVHPKSGWLFTFDPPAGRIELIERICSEPLRRSGAFEPFRYGYLTLTFGDDNETIYYLTGTGPLIAEDGRTVKETTRLVTYNIRTGARIDHGVLRLDDGRYPTMSQSIAYGPDRRIYACPWIEKPHRKEGERPRHQCDLISVADPLT